MVLQRIMPFNYSQYCHETSDFAQWMTEYVHKNEINGSTGWSAHFKNYQFPPREKSWKDGVRTRRDFHTTLVGSLGSEQDLLNVANSIVIDWGGINRRFKYKTEDVPGIQVALTVLVNETINSEWFTKYVDYLNFTHNPRIAAHSKIYETFEPNKWTIYDSRVAAALVCLVYKYWEQEEQAIASGVLQLPVPPRNLLGWQRPHPSEFPAVNNVHQASLAFVYASWLLRSVAEILRSRPQYGYPPTMEHAERYSPLDPNWQVYHVEMALWMMGNKEF